LWLHNFEPIVLVCPVAELAAAERAL
jgi:hypothetical protein